MEAAILKVVSVILFFALLCFVIFVLNSDAGD